MRQLTIPKLKLVFLILLMALILGALGTGALADENSPGEAVMSEVNFAEPVAVDVEMEVFEEPVKPERDMQKLIEAEEAYRETLEMPDIVVSDAPIVGPEPNTDTTITRDALTVPGAPTADGDFAIFRKRRIWAVPTNSASNRSEVSVLMEGRYGFATGNWWAAQSWNGGYNWGYVSPFAGLSDFCCDQILMYDKARNLWLWLRMTSLSQNQGQSNRYRISASTNNGSS